MTGHPGARLPHPPRTQVIALECRAGLWIVTTARHHDLTVPRTPPPVTDLPDDVRDALLAWLEPHAGPASGVL